MDASALHTPVMLARTLELLSPAVEAAVAAGRTPVVVDGTLGMGGHTEAMLDAHPTLVVAGIDRDPDAIRLAGQRLARFGDRFRPVETTYDPIFLGAFGLGPWKITRESTTRMHQTDLEGEDYSTESPRGNY